MDQQELIKTDGHQPSSLAVGCTALAVPSCKDGLLSNGAPFFRLPPTTARWPLKARSFERALLAQSDRFFPLNCSGQTRPLCAGFPAKTLHFGYSQSFILSHAPGSGS